MLQIKETRAFDGEHRGQALQSFFELFGQLAEGTFVVDRDAQVIWANAFTAFIGLEPDQPVVGQHISTVLMPRPACPGIEVETGRSIRST